MQAITAKIKTRLISPSKTGCKVAWGDGPGSLCSITNTLEFQRLNKQLESSQAVVIFFLLIYTLTMNSSERIAYLANIVLIARADKILGLAEEDALELMTNAIQATAEDVAAARRRVDQGDYHPTAVSRFSDNVRNLGDMLLVALVDDELADPEKIDIVQFARDIGVTQPQLDLVLSQVRRRIRQKRQASQNCPACGQNLQPGSRFCTQCGARLQGPAIADEL